MPEPRALITGHWTDLAFLTYRVDAEALAPHVPPGTEPDRWEGGCYVTVAGMHVTGLRIGGAPAPLHREYAQVNLFFPVRREVRGAEGTETRRGVVFLRDLVPHAAPAGTARLRMEEPLQPAILRRRTTPDASAGGRAVAEYVWDELIRGGRLFAEATGAEEVPPEGSIEAWLGGREWGYVGRPGTDAAEYRIHHARWPVRRAERAQLSGNLAATFGEQFADALRAPPASAVLSRGSEVRVHAPEPI